MSLVRAEGNDSSTNIYGEESEDEEMTEEELRLLSLGSCRTRGQLSSKFRKRNCKQANGLHYQSKKALRPR